MILPNELAQTANLVFIRVGRWRLLRNFVGSTKCGPALIPDSMAGPAADVCSCGIVASIGNSTTGII